MPVATPELAIPMPNSHWLPGIGGSFFAPENCGMRPLPTVHVASGGTSSSLFGDDLYVYSLSKHSRPPLKPYWGPEALLAESLGTEAGPVLA
jgi:hypothetical protein